MNGITEVLRVVNLVIVGEGDPFTAIDYAQYGAVLNLN
jgi:hypothetical protein